LEEHYHRLPTDFYTLMPPEGVGRDHTLIHANANLAMALGLDANTDFAASFNGHTVFAGFRPLAMVYSGHQFGSYVPRLGDGRALLVAQVRDASGVLSDVQLKGAGRTPYSRFGDGRAVMRSTIREYLAGEAMYALGIPTTRALCCVATHEGVIRESVEPGAILTRVAESHIRFGHFEYFHNTRRPDLVKALADHVICEHFPALQGRQYAEWFREVVRRTAEMIAAWQAVGFAHGVMNTDNMSILGLTIDYGPYGFLDAYDPGFICNHSDETGRYSFERQPSIAKWNLWVLANALVSLASVEGLGEALQEFDRDYATRYVDLMKEKLGSGDLELLEDLLALLRKSQVDYTLSMFRLGGPASDWTSLFAPEFRSEAAAWRKRYDASPKTTPRNPKYVLRNWVAESAIRAVEDHGDTAALDRIFRMLQDPFTERAEFDTFAAPPPEPMRHLCVSCSS
jgi:serine/tyrosine/threonine adenylyltransferase